MVTIFGVLYSVTNPTNAFFIMPPKFEDIFNNAQVPKTWSSNVYDYNTRFSEQKRKKFKMLQANQSLKTLCVDK